MTNVSFTRRKFIAGSAFALLGLNAITPSLAFADNKVEQEPRIHVTLQDANGQMLEDVGAPQLQCAASNRLNLGDTSKTVVQNQDGSYTMSCNTSVVPTITPRTTSEKYNYDPYATVRVTVDYTFFRGNITITSGSVYISNIAPEIELSSRYQIVAQGPYTSDGMNIVEQFTENEHTIVTGWSAVEYIPSGVSNMNLCRFQGLVNGGGVKNYVLAVEVLV